MHYSTTWDDEPSCSSGTLILWGIGRFDTLTYFYRGRAVSPRLDGTTVSSSGIYAQDSADLALVLLPSARLVEAGSGFGHNRPVAQLLVPADDKRRSPAQLRCPTIGRHAHHETSRGTEVASRAYGRRSDGWRSSRRQVAARRPRAISDRHHDRLGVSVRAEPVAPGHTSPRRVVWGSGAAAASAAQTQNALKQPTTLILSV